MNVVSIIQSYINENVHLEVIHFIFELRKASLFFLFLRAAN